MGSPSLPLQASRSKFPGMKPIEAQVMRLWLQQHEGDYDSFDYNVRIGPGRDPGPDFSANIRSMAISHSQLRIDAVAWKDGRPTLMELKNFATQPAIAQLGLYAALWVAEHPDLPRPALLIVCSAAEPGFVNYAVAANMAVQVVRPH